MYDHRARVYIVEYRAKIVKQIITLTTYCGLSGVSDLFLEPLARRFEPIESAEMSVEPKIPRNQRKPRVTRSLKIASVMKRPHNFRPPSRTSPCHPSVRVFKSAVSLSGTENNSTIRRENLREKGRPEISFENTDGNCAPRTFLGGLRFERDAANISGRRPSKRYRVTDRSFAQTQSNSERTKRNYRRTIRT